MNAKEAALVSSYVGRAAALGDEARAALRAEFLLRFPVDLQRHPLYLDEALTAAISAHDDEALETAMSLGFFVDAFAPRHAYMLAEILPQPWHRQHEDIAWVLQRLAEPETVDALYLAAMSRFEYLEWDEAFALARKCAWALGAIGTPNAIDKLRQLAGCDNSTKRQHAREQFERLGIQP